MKAFLENNTRAFVMCKKKFLGKNRQKKATSLSSQHSRAEKGIWILDGYLKYWNTNKYLSILFKCRTLVK